MDTADIVETVQNCMRKMEHITGVINGIDWRQVRRVPLTIAQRSLMLLCFLTAAALSLGIWVRSLRDGVRALERMGE